MALTGSRKTSSATGFTITPVSGDGQYRVGFARSTSEHDVRYWEPGDGELMNAGGARVGSSSMPPRRVPRSRPPIAVPTIVLHGGDDAFGRPSAEITAAERTTLPRIIDKRIVEGAGQFVPHEKPDAVASALLDALAATK